MLKQSLHQRLLQKLSPQQIQLMKLLQVPTALLEQRIKEEIEANPALDEGSDSEDEQREEEETQEADDETSVDNEDEIAEEPEQEKEYEEDFKEEKAETPEDDFNIDDYMQDYDDSPDYKYSANNRSADDENYEAPVSVSTSYSDTLNNQLNEQQFTDHQYLIAQQVIGSIDDDGYLRRELSAIANDLAFSQNVMTDEKELMEVLKVIQTFDPAGTGARNLQECLMLQLERMDRTNENTRVALRIIRDYMEEFSKKHYDKIQGRLALNDKQLKDAMQLILKLNPKPGNTFADGAKSLLHVIPDFIISNNEGILDLQLNSKNLPELRLNKMYVEMLQDYSKDRKTKSSREAATFVKQKLDSAKWFMDAIKQRNNTLATTMTAIMNYQYEFFLTGSERYLKPMILKDIAEIVQLDISTVSRVANSKYVQTTFGTFLLKRLFSEAMSTESGEEVSSHEVKNILQESVDNESKKKPITDDELAKILKEKGYNIARRTVAKYREQLNIPVARLRKQL